MQDNLGSTSVTADSSGVSTGTIRYFPFGATRFTSTVPTDKKFTGQRLDQTGLYYYGARYYDAGIGRFISADTVVNNPANPQDLNRYSYCLNNPLKYTDPDGHGWPWDDFKYMYVDPVVNGFNKIWDKGQKVVYWGAVVASAAVTGFGLYRVITTEGPAVMAELSCIWGGETGGIVAGKGAAIAEQEVAGILARTGPEAGAKITAQSGWQLGDDISKLTSKGNVPAWSTVRERFWKNEAFNNAAQYSERNLTRMREGLAPQKVSDITGRMENMELHHWPPQREGGLFSITKVWPEEHALIDPFRRLGY